MSDALSWKPGPPPLDKWPQWGWLRVRDSGTLRAIPYRIMPAGIDAIEGTIYLPSGPHEWFPCLLPDVVDHCAVPLPDPRAAQT